MAANASCCYCTALLLLPVIAAAAGAAAAAAGQSCVLLLVDLLGSYKASPEMKKRAADLRASLLQEEAKKVRRQQLALCLCITWEVGLELWQAILTCLRVQEAAKNVKPSQWQGQAYGALCCPEGTLAVCAAGNPS
jgi:hypothetical protein